MFNPEKDTSSFPFILYRCAIAFRNALTNELLHDFNEEITVDFWFILSVLWEDDNIPQGTLANKLNRDKASLSRTLDLMEEKGLVRRVAVLNDKRGTRIALTQKANDLQDKATEIATSFTQNGLKGLSPIEVKELFRMLNQVFSNIRKE